MTDDVFVSDRMQALIAAWETAVDRRVIFLSCYNMMTHNMLAAVAQDDFQDAEWVERLLDHFAGYYFNAVDAYDRQEEPSAVWRVAFEAAREPQTHVLQNLFLGINAHINYDLVLALVDMLQDGWADLPAELRRQRYEDYCKVNDIIAATVNGVQDQVIDRYDPALEVVDKLLGPLDEWMVMKLITDWREEVWQHAGELLASADTAVSVDLRQTVENHTLARASTISGKRGIGGLLDLI